MHILVDIYCDLLTVDDIYNIQYSCLRIKQSVDEDAKCVMEKWTLPHTPSQYRHTPHVTTSGPERSAVRGAQLPGACTHKTHTHGTTRGDVTGLCNGRARSNHRPGNCCLRVRDRYQLPRGHPAHLRRLQRRVTAGGARHDYIPVGK